MKSLAVFLLASMASVMSHAASTCYQVIDATGATFYRSYESPVDLSMRLGDAVAKRYRAGVHLVMSESDKCPPLDIPQSYAAARPASVETTSDAPKAQSASKKRTRKAASK
jgi:succinate dehydrogenase/fumarate reductase flavoprotein subunit